MRYGATSIEKAHHHFLTVIDFLSRFPVELFLH